MKPCISFASATMQFSTFFNICTAAILLAAPMQNTEIWVGYEMAICQNVFPKELLSWSTCHVNGK